jgi:hypothetical protein
LKEEKLTERRNPGKLEGRKVNREMNPGKVEGRKVTLEKLKEGKLTE